MAFAGDLLRRERLRLMLGIRDGARGADLTAQYIGWPPREGPCDRVAIKSGILHFMRLEPQAGRL